ncbi:hypothetical protein GF351_03460 [Candidatus Woesearchaeota archaeon]|nr:hypothetical protein [Candidatus Woesearchaeota archaeon]
MEIFQYLLASALVYAGPLAGVFLAFSAREELKPGKRYFELLQKILLSLVIFFALSGLGIHNLAGIAAAVLSFLLFLRFWKDTGQWAAYPVFAVILYFSSHEKEAFFMLSGLMFIYGLPYAAVLMPGRKHRLTALWNMALRNISFLLIAVGMVFIAGI